MPKINIKTVLREGATGKFADVNYSSKEKKEDLKEVKRKQEEILNRETVDWKKLSSFVIKV